MAGIHQSLSKIAMTKGLTHIPTPSSISYMWNLGSLLGAFMGFQVLSGLFLSFRYSSLLDEAFSSVVLACMDSGSGWLIRSIHSNGASMIFFLMYTHIARGLYFGGYRMGGTWVVGVTMYFACMATAFLGYVLPWGQMSYWGATVITNLLSTIPYLGGDLVVWIWGGYSVSGPTLIRFFSLHFTLPFAILFLIGVHIVFLHLTGSSNPLGLGLNYDKIHFHPAFTYKDVLGFVVVGVIFLAICVLVPDLFMDCDNFIEADPLVTPPHIQPEWYFLFAYAILRSVPSKLGGVVALVFSVLILYIFGLWEFSLPHPKHNAVVKFIWWGFFFNFFFLTWLGMMPAESYYLIASKLSALVYFGSLFLLMMIGVDR